MRHLFTAWCLAGVVAVATPAFVERVVAQGAAPAGATAKCVDGSYSKAKTQRGACSNHGGVATWMGERTAAPRAATHPAETERQPVPRGTTGSTKAATPRTVPAPRNAADATAQCNDGTYSYAHQHRGACSNHGGVKSWFK